MCQSLRSVTDVVGEAVCGVCGVDVCGVEGAAGVSGGISLPTISICESVLRGRLVVVGDWFSDKVGDLAPVSGSTALGGGFDGDCFLPLVLPLLPGGVEEDMLFVSSLGEVI